jgi:hypothetical protein
MSVAAALALGAGAVVLTTPSHSIAQSRGDELRGYQGAPAPASCPCPGPVRPQMLSVMAEFGGGGSWLRGAIARAVEDDATLALDAVRAACPAGPPQKAAIGAGLADATNFFKKAGSDFARSAEGQIRYAMQCADPVTRIGYVDTDVKVIGGSEGIPGFGNAGATTCVSPSRKGC